MQVAIIDFGSQWTHRIHRTLKYLGVNSEILPVSAPLKKILMADALVFSGGAIRIGLGESKKIGNARKYLENFEGPIMGVCAGQQFIGMHFGGKARPAAGPEYGKVELIVDDHDELFEGLPGKFTVGASHNDEVVDTPGFSVLAHSKDCSNHAFKSNSRPIYGTLFHPEVEHTEHGDKIYANFLKIVKR
ncbi:MAG: GMP synthase subunit A [Candidatus Micrarchaeota archaeon]|nr:GMP synthase subunit A [Candidatus Micrarchaeota archaeon]